MKSDKQIHVEDILQMLDVSLNDTDEIEADWKTYKYEALEKPLMKLSKNDLYVLKIAIQDLRRYMRNEKC